MGDKVGPKTGSISNFHEYDSLDIEKSNLCQYSGAVEKKCLTQSLSRGCRGTGYREDRGGRVVEFGQGINRGKQGGVSTATGGVPGIGP